MKFKQAMKTNDADDWRKAVKEEHEQMMKHKVWKPVPKEDVPKDAKILTSTWAMKKNQTEHSEQDSMHKDTSKLKENITGSMIYHLQLPTKSPFK